MLSSAGSGFSVLRTRIFCERRSGTQELRSVSEQPNRREPMKRSFLYLLVLCTFFYQAAAGQTLVTTGALRGRVTDPTGASVLGAQVVLLEESTRRTQSRTTDRDGVFFFSALPVG